MAQRLRAEGSEKTWDQCRIKLKNLKSQYRFVKERIPNIDEVDLEDDEVLKQLIADCQGMNCSIARQETNIIKDLTGCKIKKMPIKRLRLYYTRWTL